MGYSRWVRVVPHVEGEDAPAVRTHLRLRQQGTHREGLDNVDACKYRKQFQPSQQPVHETKAIAA